MKTLDPTVILHALVAVAGIVAYTVLTATGHDGNTVLVAALAYGGGATVQKVTS